MQGGVQRPPPPVDTPPTHRRPAVRKGFHSTAPSRNPIVRKAGTKVLATMKLMNMGRSRKKADDAQTLYCAEEMPDKPTEMCRGHPLGTGPASNPSKKRPTPRGALFLYPSNRVHTSNRVNPLLAETDPGHGDAICSDTTSGEMGALFGDRGSHCMGHTQSSLLMSALTYYPKTPPIGAWNRPIPTSYFTPTPEYTETILDRRVKKKRPAGHLLDWITDMHTDYATDSRTIAILEAPPPSAAALKAHHTETNNLGPLSYNHAQQGFAPGLAETISVASRFWRSDRGKKLLCPATEELSYILIHRAVLIPEPVRPMTLLNNWTAVGDEQGGKAGSRAIAGEMEILDITDPNDVWEMYEEAVQKWESWRMRMTGAHEFHTRLAYACIGISLKYNTSEGFRYSDILPKAAPTPPNMMSTEIAVLTNVGFSVDSARIWSILKTSGLLLSSSDGSLSQESVARLVRGVRALYTSTRHNTVYNVYLTDVRVAALGLFIWWCGSDCSLTDTTISPAAAMQIGCKRLGVDGESTAAAEGVVWHITEQLHTA